MNRLPAGKTVLDKFVVWLLSARASAPLRRWSGALIGRAIDMKCGVLIFPAESELTEAMSIINQIRSETEMQLTNSEAYWVFKMAKATAKIEGDMVEAGVYRGGSAKLICEAKGNRVLHLFDTFAGLPAPSEADDQLQGYAGKCYARLEDVTSYLRGYPNVCFYKGLFPKTAEPIEHRRFSFVHLDVNLYSSTLDSLKYLYPRMNRGGIILCHDYGVYDGVKRAVDEFLADKPEVVLQPSKNQCLIAKS